MAAISVPILTVVVAARNDDRGGNMLHRMQVFVNGLLGLAGRHRLSLELIIVEWNPPLGTPRLIEVLDWSALGKDCRVRIVEVPEGFHSRLPQADRMPLFQFIAKNVGIRRAEGDFVLATNLDLLYSAPLMDFLGSGALSPDCFYRVDRYDVAPEVPAEVGFAQQLTFCKRHVVRIHAATGSRPASALKPIPERIARAIGGLRGGWSAWTRKSSSDGIHTVAAGDFTLMARQQWHALRGYPEISSHAYVDGLICYMAASSGLHQVILRDPMRVYHQEHRQMFLGETSERPVMDYQQYRAWCDEMMRTGRPLILNDDGWGLARESLKEAHLGG